jgi:hypothetical protein
MPPEGLQAIVRERRNNFLCPAIPTIHPVGWQPKMAQMHHDAAYPDRPKTYKEIVRKIVEDVWGEDFDQSGEEKQVGSVGGTKIMREVTILSKRPANVAGQRYAFLSEYWCCFEGGWPIQLSCVLVPVVP